MIYAGNKGTLFWGNDYFLVMNDHFGGPSVHCGQILQQNSGNFFLGTFEPPSPPKP